jgi:hypothetical protein
MRLPSGMRGACAPIAATPLKLSRVRQLPERRPILIATSHAGYLTGGGVWMADWLG